MRRLLALATATAIGFVGAGATSSASTPRDDLQSFCKARVALEQALHLSLGDVSDVGSDDLTALLSTLTTNAPAAVENDAQQLAGILSTSGLPGLATDDGRKAKHAVDSYVVANCGFRIAPITATDRGYEGVPQVFQGGTVAIQMTNTSTDERHEAVVLKIDRGVRTRARKLLASSGDDLAKIAKILGIATAEPGESDVTIVDLTPGRYVVADLLRSSGDESGAAHWKRGLVAEFRVVA